MDDVNPFWSSIALLQDAALLHRNETLAGHVVPYFCATRATGLGAPKG